MNESCYKPKELHLLAACFFIHMGFTITIQRMTSDPYYGLAEGKQAVAIGIILCLSGLYFLAQYYRGLRCVVRNCACLAVAILLFSSIPVLFRLMNERYYELSKLPSLLCLLGLAHLYHGKTLKKCIYTNSDKES